MAPRSLWNGSIAFGLVTVPVKVYTATESKSVHFREVHAKDGGKIEHRRICPKEDKEVGSDELVRGYQVSARKWVELEDDEIAAAAGSQSRLIDVDHFVPASDIDPVYFEKAYYLGPDKGGEKAYRLLTDAMMKTGRVAVATFVMRGKESLVLIRPSSDGLMLHTMFFSDEVRNFGEIEKGLGAKIRDGEMDLAKQLIDGLSNDDFTPENYEDRYRLRVVQLIESKVEGKEITVTAPEAARAQVIDLMDALKESLAKRVPDGKKPPSKAPRRAEPAVEAPRAGKRASGSKK